MKRCLFVDDSSVIRKVARRILADSGLLMIEAGAGRDAIEMCAEQMPEFIVVDNSLPDMPVEEFIRTVRSIASPIRPRIALCTAEMDIGAIMRAKRAGADSYMLKPFNRTQLLEGFRSFSAAA
ncbi:MAG: response regulator [Rhizobiales bacterium]|nr:response regulator [Hyphomicrobiales bacterium]